MFSSKICIAFILLVLASSTALALTDAEIQTQVDQKISERHPTGKPEWWRALGPNAPRVIISLYETTDRTDRCVRLLEGLGAFPDDPKAVDFLKQQAEASDDEILRNTVIRSVASGSGAREEDFISKFLSHSDPQTRLTAARALQEMGAAGDARARLTLDKYMSEEKAPWIVSELKQGLPKALPPLKPVSTSEDRLNTGFAGNWKGYLLSPSGAGDLALETVELSLQSRSGSELSGQIKFTKKPRAGAVIAPRSFPLLRLTGRASRISGAAPGGIVPGAGVMGEIPLEGVLTGYTDSLLLEIQLPRAGSFIVLRRAKD